MPSRSYRRIWIPYGSMVSTGRPRASAAAAGKGVQRPDRADQADGLGGLGSVVLQRAVDAVCSPLLREDAGALLAVLTARSAVGATHPRISTALALVPALATGVAADLFEGRSPHRHECRGGAGASDQAIKYTREAINRLPRLLDQLRRATTLISCHRFTLFVATTPNGAGAPHGAPPQALRLLSLRILA